MGVDHKLLKTSENFKGLDLRSSDVVRSQEYATDMRNAEYRISGAINKRKGFTNKRSTGFIKGMTTFKNISPNGAVTDELIYVEDANIKKEVSFDLVAYRSSSVSTLPIYLNINKEDNNVNIVASDGSGQTYYNKSFSGTDNISTFLDNFQYRSTMPNESANPIINYDEIDMSEARLTWHRDLNNPDDFIFSYIGQSYTNSPEVGPFHTRLINMYVPLGNDLAALTAYINATYAHEEQGPSVVAPFSHSDFTYKNDLLQFGGLNLLNTFDQGSETGFLHPSDGFKTPDAFEIVRGHFNTDYVFVLEGSGDETPSEVKNWIVFKIYPFWSRLDPYVNSWDTTAYGSSLEPIDYSFKDSDQSWTITKNHVKNLYDYRLSEFSKGEVYNENNFRWVFALGISQLYSSTSTNLSTYGLYSNVHTPTDTSGFKSISLQDLLTNFNTSVDNINQGSTYFTLNKLNKLPLSSAKESVVSIEARNTTNESVPQFLNESILSLNTNITQISNNASSTFPTTITTGSIEEAVGTLSWTSADYEDILTENVNFASLNNVLYISNGIDELLKYDGEDVYRAGLPNCSKDISTFSFNTTSTNYLHNISPGQVEYYTVDDSYYANNSPDPNAPLDEALPANKKYLIELNSGSNYKIKIADEGASYPSSWTTRSYATAGVTKVISGTGLQIEVLTDSVGEIKNYYTVEKGKGYKGEDDNGNAQNYINITKKLFTYTTGDDVITYGRVDIVDVSSQVRERTYEYRFAYEYTDYKGNIISSQPSDPVKLVVGSSRSVNLTFPLTISDLSTFKTDGVFDTVWQEANGVTFPTTLTDTNYPIEKLSGENRLRILVYRSKGYSPIAGEVVGQYYKIADIPYGYNTPHPTLSNTYLGVTRFTDTYHDEPNDAEAATQYDPVINPFLAFVEPIKRKDLPPKGKYLTVFKNCLVIAGQNDNVNNVQYSLPKNFTTGEIGSEYFPDDDNGIVVESPFGSKITAISALRDALFVFHKDSIFSVTGNINQLELPSVNLITKEGGVGCTSQASIEEFKGGLAFVSHTGVFSISNQGLSEISEIIKPLFLQDNFIKEKAISYNWTDRNLLLICIPDYIVQGDQEYNTLTDTMEAYISKDSLILAFDYYRGAWLRWDTIEFTNGITEVNGVLNFTQLRNTTNTLAVVNNQGDTDDYSDNGSPINFVYETNWESLGDPTTPKKFLRLKVHSFDTDGVFESPGFLLEAGIQKNYQNYNEGKITFDFGAITGGGWGNFSWGNDSWGSLPSQYLKSKLPTGKARSFKIRFANNENNENVLITNYELEIAAPFRQEIKE